MGRLGCELYEPVVVLKPEQVQAHPTARIDSFCKLEGGNGIHIGRCVHISSYCHINVGGGFVWIGDYVGIASGARILGGSNQPDAPSMSASAPADMQHVERAQTLIGHYAFVGAGATVMAGVTIGEGAVVGAGAVVTKSVPPWEIWAGVPAAKIGEREHDCFGTS